MAYIRYNTVLPSRKTSGVFVIGDKTSLVNFDHGSVPYQTVREWFKSKTDDEFKEALSCALDLHGESLDHVCEGLFEERNAGEWDKPFEFEQSPGNHSSGKKYSRV